MLEKPCQEVFKLMDQLHAFFFATWDGSEAACEGFLLEAGRIPASFRLYWRDEYMVWGYSIGDGWAWGIRYRATWLTNATASAGRLAQNRGASADRISPSMC